MEEKIRFFKSFADQNAESIDPQDFSDLEVGDTLTRILGQKVILPVIVVGKGNGMIIVSNFSDAEEEKQKIIRAAKFLRMPIPDSLDERPTWQFDETTGLEIDTDLGWDGKTITGSYLKRNK